MLELRCPGKVFILGEYACLEGFPALVGTIEPEFSLKIVPGRATPSPFAPESPAGRYLASHGALLRGYTLEWKDPYDTPIGVGSSSAQFVLAVTAVHHLLDKPAPSAAELLKLYWETVDSTSSVRPSGADVAAQSLGGVVVVHGENPPQRLSPWRAEGSFLLAFSGHKAKTHEHLADLNRRGFPRGFEPTLRELGRISRNGAEAWERADAATLGKALTAYQRTLAGGGLASVEFTSMIERAGGWPGVLGCKGSGAQGGDCALFLVENRAKSDVRARILDMAWQPFDVRWSAARNP